MSDYGWDPEKDSKNKKKHGITFEEAVEVFKQSPFIYFGEDKTEDYSERRLTAAGITKREELLFIVFENPENEDYYHIIHTKKFERSHLRHFENPNDRREIEALLQYFKSKIHGKR